MNLNEKYVLCRDVTWQAVGKEAIIMNLNSGDYFSLNDTGAEIFLAIVNGRSLSSLVSAQQKTYGKSEAKLKEDALDLLRDLIKNKIIKKTS